MQEYQLNARDCGALGDGHTLDSPALNRALQKIASKGSGKLTLPPGTYLCYSLRLCSGLTLSLEEGARLLAATPSGNLGYDAPEPNPWGDAFQYQDFGHSHWHNSLLWGENLRKLTIEGPGLIDGLGLAKNLSYQAQGPNGTSEERPSNPASNPTWCGLGNKAIGLKNCTQVTLRGFTLFRGGHFAILATGVDDLLLENLRIDTQRDGIDIDACQRVKIRRCKVNSPNDDAIVLKASYALGEIKDCTDIEISDCAVSGFDLGSLLDGTKSRNLTQAPDGDGPTGRIKIGTESNGSFRRIQIRRCCFERSRGLAIETVDGGVIEDLVVSDLSLQEVTSAALFLRLGNRARGPKETRVGALRRITIERLHASGVDARFPIILAGLPGHPIEELTLRDCEIESWGGLNLEMVATQPAALVNPFFLGGDEPGLQGPRQAFAVPEREKAYPEPCMFGLLPASGIYARHLKGFKIEGFRFSFAKPDARPLIILDRVEQAFFVDVQAPAETAGGIHLMGSPAPQLL